MPDRAVCERDTGPTVGVQKALTETLLFRKALVEVEKLHPLAAAAPVNIERKHAFTRVRPLAKQQMPASGRAADANRNLSE